MLGLKYAGGNHSYISKKIKEYEIDTTHFKGQAWSIGRQAQNRKPAAKLLVQSSTGGYREKAYRLRRALTEVGRDYVCACCGLDGQWNGKKIVLQVHHKNNDFCDNRLENLEYLCPNCHSQE